MLHSVCVMSTWCVLTRAEQVLPGELVEVFDGRAPLAEGGGVEIGRAEVGKGLSRPEDRNREVGDP